MNVNLQDEFPDSPGFWVVDADTHLTFCLSPASCSGALGPSLLNCSQKGQTAMVAVICVAFALKTHVSQQVSALSKQATPLEGGKPGCSADLRGAFLR